VPTKRSLTNQPPDKAMPHNIPPLLPAPPTRQGLTIETLRLPSPEELGLASLPYKATVPDEEACFALWDTYDMLPHIREHSKTVAFVAEYLVVHAVKRQLIDPDAIALTRASALLHDIAKSYTIQYGGSHAQIGASWSIAHNKHYGIAQAILNHIEWPWAFPLNIAHPALFVLYADKRVRHNTIVSMNERYEDLLSRYGRNAAAIASLHVGWKKSLELESAIEAQLEIDIREYSFDCGRLVP